jgi:DNA-binding YbaB/EbfC family protein
MFGNLGNLGDMMKNAQQMAARMQEKQAALRSKVVEADAGGGMVKAKMNGAGELVSLNFEKDVVDPADPELLADLIIAAVNSARRKVDEMKAESMQEMAGGIDLSALGIDLSGLS